jgi:hypothetical protein
MFETGVLRRILGPKERERGWGAMKWFYLAQDRDQWRVLLST